MVFRGPMVGGAYTRGGSASFPSDAPGCALQAQKEIADSTVLWYYADKSQFVKISTTSNLQIIFYEESI